MFVLYSNHLALCTSSYFVLSQILSLHLQCTLTLNIRLKPLWPHIGIELIHEWKPLWQRRTCFCSSDPSSMLPYIAWDYDLFLGSWPTGQSPDYGFKFDLYYSIHGHVQCCSKYVQGSEVLLRLCVSFYRTDCNYYLIWECQKQHTGLWTSSFRLLWNLWYSRDIWMHF